jgi:hypothetical protein
LDCLESGLTLAARSGGHPDDQQESDRHDSQHFERPEMMDHQAARRSGRFSSIDGVAGDGHSKGFVADRVLAV